MADDVMELGGHQLPLERALGLGHAFTTSLLVVVNFAVISVIVCCRARPGYCILIAQGATQWQG